MKQFSTKAQNNETEKPHDKQDDKKTEDDDKYYQPDEDFEQTPQFKAYRQVWFGFKRFIKYTSSGAMLAFIYHMVLIKKMSTPEDKYYTEPHMLGLVKDIDW